MDQMERHAVCVQGPLRRCRQVHWCPSLTKSATRCNTICAAQPPMQRNHPCNATVCAAQPSMQRNHPCSAAIRAAQPCTEF
eukprot:scaffold305329_cov17-Tisochrysis_lutea.AAC.1